MLADGCACCIEDEFGLVIIGGSDGSDGSGDETIARFECGGEDKAECEVGTMAECEVSIKDFGEAATLSRWHSFPGTNWRSDPTISIVFSPHTFAQFIHMSCRFNKWSYEESLWRLLSHTSWFENIDLSACMDARNSLNKLILNLFHLPWIKNIMIVIKV